MDLRLGRTAGFPELDRTWGFLSRVTLLQFFDHLHDVGPSPLEAESSKAGIQGQTP